MNIFYVYVYLDPRRPGTFVYGENQEYCFDYEPFYVGKGKGGQWLSHLNNVLNNSINDVSRNLIKSGKIKHILFEGLEPIIIKFKEELLEDDAYNLEYILVKTIGRIDNETGPLSNLSDGGKGGTRGWIPTSEWREKNKQRSIDRWKDPETRSLMLKRISEGITDESRKRARKSCKEHYLIPENREKIRVIQLEVQNRPEQKLKNSESIKNSWINPEIRKKRILGIKKVQATPEYKGKISIAVKKRYEDPEKNR